MNGIARSAAVLGLLAVTVAPLTAASAGSASGADKQYQPLTQSERHDIASVSAKTLRRVGAGSSPASFKRIKDPALTRRGKPEFVYIMAEFCPFCAATNWSVAVALSRFGKLRGLRTMTSSSSDVDPDTATVSFRYASYRSRFLDFDGIVNARRDRQPLQKVPPRIHRLWVKHSPNHQPAYPFLYFGGRVVDANPAFDPATLKGLSRAQIAASLDRPHSKVARGVDGGANRITAAICETTGGRPGRICDTSTIRKAERSIG